MNLRPYYSRYMYNLYNLKATSINEILSTFRKFLLTENISKGSTRSYVSDVKFFLSWFFSFLQSNGLINQSSALLDTDLIFYFKYFNQKTLESYKNFLLSSNIPTKTINRRFSSLRKFGSFSHSQFWIKENYFDTLKTILINRPFPETDCHLAEFKNDLWKNGASKSTIRNYLNDVRQYLGWNGGKNVSENP